MTVSARFHLDGTWTGAYVQSSSARMKRVEDNLDGLIRAITAEHITGKSKL